MNPYSREDVKHIYADILNYAHRCYSRGNDIQALKAIEASSRWAYNLNFIYSDADAERLVKDIAEWKIEKKRIDNPIHNRCVLLDSFLLDNRGLSQQYLRAMMANKMEILVIYTTAGGKIGKDILAEIQAYDKAKIISYPKKIDRIKESQEIVDEIENFAPAHIFLHLTPWDVIALMACHSIEGSKKYNINLTDHAYWMGASFIDFNIEFRPYGYTVSLEKRGLKQDQLLALPYYPITPISSEFEGFPQLPKESIKVFTGGALYKMLGKNDIFFRIMERILRISQNIVILVAGFDKSEFFEKKKETIEGKERIIQIGIRKDIDAVFENCDIFLETYPTTGALMAQYAAMHAKPILAYRDVNDMENAIEELIIMQHSFRSFTDLDEMTSYTEKLVNDVNFRHVEGMMLKDGMMTQDRFNDTFSAIITKLGPIADWDLDPIDYDSFFERYLDLENMQYEETKALIRKLKYGVLNALFSSPSIIIEQYFLLLFNKIKYTFKSLL